MPSFALASSVGVARNARFETKSDTVKPMPPSAAMPTTSRPARAVGQRAEPEPAREPRESGDADQLADDESHHDAVRDR